MATKRMVHCGRIASSGKSRNLEKSKLRHLGLRGYGTRVLPPPGVLGFVVPKESLRTFHGNIQVRLVRLCLQGAALRIEN